MIRIRPHHLLCMKGFRGKGYSGEFIQNMYRVIADIRGNNDIEIELRLGLDAICKCCPNVEESTKCKAHDKVNHLDSRILEVLNILEGTYKYREIDDTLRKVLTLRKFKEICEKCSWYSLGYCEEGIFKNKL